MEDRSGIKWDKYKKKFSEFRMALKRAYTSTKTLHSSYEGTFEICKI